MRALLVVLALLAAAPRAHAECGIPSWVGTTNGRTVPTVGSLYAYVERGVQPKLVWGGVGDAALVHVSPAVWRVDYAGEMGATLTVTTAGDDAWVYHLDAHWQAPETAPHLLQYWHDMHASTSSWAESLMLQTDQEVAAYRVRWTATAGDTTEVVLPPRTDLDGRSALELGKILCGSISFPFDELAGGGHLELTALRLDRSEIAVGGVPPRLSILDMPTSDDGLRHALAIARPAPPPHVHARALVAPDRSLGIVVLLAFALGLYLAIRITLGASARGTGN